ncbi:MAG TPA: metallophosphoesterase, partial [Mycobacterium sp.]
MVTLLFGVPWWTLLSAGTRWPTAMVVIGSAVFAAGFVALPVLMMRGHGRSHWDWAAATADALLGAVWVLFVWAVLGQVLRLALLMLGVEDPARSRVVAGAVVAIVLGLLVWGYAEAMRVPRIRHVEVTIPGLGAGLNGLRVAMITDTHFGPIDRSRWSAAVVARVNGLNADLVCHVGDIADGTVEVR